MRLDKSGHAWRLPGTAILLIALFVMALQSARIKAIRTEAGSR